ncbi:hypothetical protein [Noviherbaspirillum malthae]|jgi:hypothetical protein|uniref:hypothetical protein n=1 Tax=Noviherbaspirillum malthae TaxID=1260987 RepID=UPI00188EBD43|nr:hypothetical protein [Noviherbaspirillum malthae]
MSTRQWLAVAAWGLLPIAALAQQEQAKYNPADASAPVNAVPYESAFKGFRSNGDEQASPDKIWRSVNDEMGKLGGHAGHMNSGQGQPAASSAVATVPEKQGSGADHGMHH